MELHTADKHVHLVTLNMLIYNERRKSIFLSVTVYVLPFRLYLAKLDSYSVCCSSVFQILQGRVYLFLKLPLSDWIK